MDRETLRELLARRPFEPFRIVMSSGDRYDVRHPDAAMLLKSKLVVAVPAAPSEDPPDRFAICTLLHIAHVETLQAA